MSHRPTERAQFWIVFGVSLLALLSMAPELSGYLRNGDHGYQLSLARLIVLGAVPFDDLIFHYGPLVALTSSLALKLSGSLLGETLVCAVAYAATLAVLSRTARRRLGVWSGWLLPVLGAFLIARFYKWYFWLFPSLTLLWFSRVLPLGAGRAEPSASAWWVAGLIAGLCGLYRLDLGVVLWIASGVGIVVCEWQGGVRARAVLRSALALGVGAIVPLAVWAIALDLWAGSDAIGRYLHATLDGGTGVVTGWSKRPPDIRGAALLSPAVGLRLALVLMPAAYLLALGVGIGTVLANRNGPAEPNARFLVITAVLGFGMMPQALYRADYQHFFQALPPLLLVLPLLGSWVRALGVRSSPPARRILWGSGALLVLAFGVAALGLSERSGSDLASPLDDPVARYRELRSGAEQTPRSELGIVAAAVRERTHPDEPILVVPIAPQLYFFAARPMSGVLNIYATRILDTEAWRRFNLDHVEAHPPALIAVERTFLDPGSADTLGFRESQPELYSLLTTGYPETLFEHEDWVLLGPPPAAGPDDGAE